MSSESQIGVVVIGRNEGERLKRCLRSLQPDCLVMVYVDSGSTDGSVEFARSLGVDVVDLDLSRPFTMARGRNAGFNRLCDQNPDIQFVQFVDGDCEVMAGWIPAAVSALESHSDVVAVCGRLREKHPEASRFNLLCDLEWDQPEGYAKSCGGIAMFRLAPLREVGGFNEHMIAGEEGDLCFRLRGNGWKVLRVGQEMALHDAAMTRWSQWIQRAIRGGRASAEGAYLHGRSEERYKIRSTRSAVFWGAFVPLLSFLILLTGCIVNPTFMIGLILLGLGYLMLGFRIYRGNRRLGRQPRISLTSAWYCILSMTPETVGVLRFWVNHWAGKRSQLIEYK